MRWRLPAGAIGVALAVTLLTTVSGTALAYFSTTGMGDASAGVSKLSAPSITAATPAVGGTVALTWSAVTPPGSGTVSYSVSRDGGEPAGTCPTSPAGQAVTTCTDSGLNVGTHSYVVTARWRSWSASSSTSTAKITIGAADHLVLTAASTTPAAGASDNLTITAKDENESTVTTYTSSHSLTFSGASASPGGTAPTVVNTSDSAIVFGNATAINFTAGVATVTSSRNGLMKLYRSGATSIDVSDGSISTSSPLVVTVAAGAATKFSLAAASTTPVAGVADNLTATALDTYGNTATSYVGAHNLTFSGASASPGGSVPTVSSSTGVATPFASATSIEFSAGMASVSGAANGVMTLYKSGTTNVKVSDGPISTPPIWSSPWRPARRRNSPSARPRRRRSPARPATSRRPPRTRTPTPQRPTPACTNSSSREPRRAPTQPCPPSSTAPGRRRHSTPRPRSTSPMAWPASAPRKTA